MQSLEINLKQWSEWLLSKGLHERSRMEYINYISKILPIQLTEEFFIEALNKFNNGVARAALINLLAYIKSSNQFEPSIRQEAKTIELPKVTGRKRKRIPIYYTESEIFQAVKMAHQEKYKLGILVSFYGGLRCSELVGDYAIKPYSFNFQTWIKDPDKDGELRVIGKGNKEGVVFIPQKLMLRLYNWIKHDVTQRQTKDDPLFDFGPRRWHKVLADIGKKATGKHLHPHVLRHSTNMWLKSLGWDDNERKVYMRHEDISTTIKYDHTAVADLKDKFTKNLTDSKTHLNLPENNI